VRYIALSRKISPEHSHLALEVVTDLAVISDKEAVPSSFVCIDFTADSSNILVIVMVKDITNPQLIFQKREP